MSDYHSVKMTLPYSIYMELRQSANRQGFLAVESLLRKLAYDHLEKLPPKEEESSPTFAPLELAIMKFFRDNPAPLRVSELAKQLSACLNSCHVTAKKLANKGLLQQLPAVIGKGRGAPAHEYQMTSVGLEVLRRFDAYRAELKDSVTRTTENQLQLDQIEHQRIGAVTKLDRLEAEAMKAVKTDFYEKRSDLKWRPKALKVLKLMAMTNPAVMTDDDVDKLANEWLLKADQEVDNNATTYFRLIQELGKKAEAMGGPGAIIAAMSQRRMDKAEAAFAAELNAEQAAKEAAQAQATPPSLSTDALEPVPDP